MNKFLIVLSLLLGTSLWGQEPPPLDLTVYTHGPMGLPSKGQFETYGAGFSLTKGIYSIGYDHSKLFGNSVNVGVYLAKPRIYIKNSYYYNNPYNPSVNPWGNWLSVSKKITLWKSKSQRKQ